MIRLAVRVAREQAGAALADLLAFSPSGVEEIEIDDATIEYVLYGAEHELPTLEMLHASLGAAVVAVDSREIADDWQERWREFHKPVVVAERFRVRAPWHPAEPDGLIDLVIEPAQAFGTGAHATTRMCLELLVTLAPGSGPLLDIGCGSGVLAIAAAKLGFAPVRAIDNDPLAVAATAANAAANDALLEARQADLRTDALAPARTIVANLLLEPLLALAGRLERPPERLIASGLLLGQGEALAQEFAVRHDLHEIERRSEGEWLALLFGRPADPRVSS
ncbi:MAG: 50S ribosomal protein L11 methyltransferase [Solirubrobacteraceae bacterium]